MEHVLLDQAKLLAGGHIATQCRDGGTSRQPGQTQLKSAFEVSRQALPTGILALPKRLCDVDHQFSVRSKLRRDLYIKVPCLETLALEGLNDGYFPTIHSTVHAT